MPLIMFPVFAACIWLCLLCWVAADAQNCSPWPGPTDATAQQFNVSSSSFNATALQALTYCQEVQRQALLDLYETGNGEFWDDTHQGGALFSPGFRYILGRNFYIVCSGLLTRKVTKSRLRHQHFRKACVTGSGSLSFVVPFQDVPLEQGCDQWRVASFS